MKNIRNTMIGKINEYHILKPKRIIVLVFMGIVLSLVLRDFITPIAFTGKSFSGRSFPIRAVLLITYSIFNTTVLFLFSSFLKIHLSEKENSYLSKFYNKVSEFLRPISDRLIRWEKENQVSELILKNRISWLGFSISTVISILVYLTMEWIFLISKPSFMTLLSFREKFSILSFAFSFLASITLIVFCIAYVITRVFTRKSLPSYFLFFPSLIFTITIMLMVDNFTYTVFRFGIISSSGVVRLIYLLIFLFLTIFILRDLVKININFKRIVSKCSIKGRNFLLLPILLFVIMPLLNSRMYALNSSHSEVVASTGDTDIKPHIVLISVEALNADHMSLYGYERDTTPFIREEFSNSALIAKNSFTNSAHTAGSLTSILTSKYPTNTRVLYPPDILRSEDAYQHLPGILKSYGYKTAQYSVDHYADAYQLNMLNAFDEVNGQKNQGNVFLLTLNRFLSGNVAYFYYELNTRLMDKLSHIFYIEQKENTFRQITESSIHYDDFEKFDEVINLLENAISPYFFHIHWMRTHGSKYFPYEQVFSKGQDPSQQDDWEIDFYDDSILEFDSSLSDFWGRLEKILQNKNTILIITSDHGMKFSTRVRIPLIIQFPDDAFSKTISANVQNLDIAPTLLDYLNIMIPNWMDGKSLLADENQSYPIISVSNSSLKTTTGRGFQIDSAYIEPPFYQFSSIYVVDCNKWYSFDLDNLKWSNGNIPNYPNPCQDGDLLTYDQTAKTIIERLSIDGFELTNNVIESIHSLE